ncbi:uncharacterized protein LOC133830137 [Humulus lupulus]|uniref:uncharacterized protein LOC133830137 n=1 Tax=Humulus lupulus TaxID=3486 RepID=UPI002B417768|nr:uncharacterized protein LOC133830137 [Humulus lupulus]XP_062116043.1 uncharacterized protein LOC133830137 [Humulus lupulus]
MDANMKLVLMSALILLLLPSSSSTSEPATTERSLVVAPSSVLQLSRGLPVQNTPGKHGKTVVCERIHIRGLSRVKNLRKFAHSVTVKVSVRNSSVHAPNAEVCFHRNISVAMGMCPEGHWEKVFKGSWARHGSPFDHKLLDIRTASSSLESFEVSIKEEFFLHRIIFLVFGIVMMSVASFLSTSLIFYYGSAMAVGVILVILVFLFQGMKLIPFGGKRFAIFIPSSIAGLAYFFKLFVPGALHSILELIGIDQEMYDPLVKFLLAFVILTGAWMGFWVVRKLVLTEDGSVDISTALFVAWSIRILAALMILQSSADPLLATVALVSGIVVSSMLRRVFRWRFIRRVCRKLLKAAKKSHSISPVPDYSESEDSLDDYTCTIQNNDDSNFLRRSSRKFAMASSISPGQWFGRGTPGKLLDAELYPSSFHDTTERKRFTKQGWEKFTKDSTEAALEELVSSPCFGKWVHQNADRITVTPNSGKSEGKQRRSFWF